MTIDENYKDITFWDPRFNCKFNLKGRIQNSKKLKRFLNREVNNYAQLDDENIVVEAPEEESLNEDELLLKKKKNNDLFDDRKPNGEGEEDVYDYSHDSYQIEIDNINFNEKDYDLVNNEFNVNKTKASNFLFF